MTGEAEYWDSQADTFDHQPDHGLLDTSVRQAWRRLLLAELPPAPAAVADLGSGTGTLSVLLAAEGYAVTGLDFAPQMIRAARAKARAAGVGHGPEHMSREHHVEAAGGQRRRGGV
jgi:ubiquinone/menaquinone biosynthesis C-methylase UbiE